jgi:hypothetical protein
MKRIISVVLIVCFMSFLFGCATGRDTGAVAGGAIGAGVGAAVSKHNPWLGALIGGVLGAVAGAAIGNYIDEQKKDRQQSIRDTNYIPSQGQVVRIENADTTPVTVRPGETIGLRANYYVLAPDQRAQVKIRETRVIRYNGQPIMDPIVREVIKDQGMASSTAKIPIPSEAQPGNYEVITIIDNGSKQDQSVSRFYVQNI